MNQFCRTSYCFLLLTFYLSISYAQAPDTLWTKMFGGSGYENGRSVQQTHDGGYIVAGYTHSFGAGGSDIYLIRTDPDGAVIWTKTYGGTDNDIACSVVQTSDSGFVVGGTTSSFGAGNTDIYLIKTNAFGDTVFTQTYGDTLFEVCVSVLQCFDNGYIIVGNRKKTETKHKDILLIRTNPLGDIRWTKTYNGSVCSIEQTPDSGYIITGQYNYRDVHKYVQLIKTDENGAVVWTGKYGGRPSLHINDAETTTDGGYIAVGSIWVFERPVPNPDLYLIKIDANGDSVWVKTYGGPKKDIGYAVQATDDGGYIITGITGAGGHGMWLVRTDLNGDTLWTKTIGGIITDYGFSVQQTSDGGYIIVGQTLSFGPYDIYLVRIKPERH